MKTMRRNRLTSKPNIGFTASVMSAVPMKSQRMLSRPPLHAEGVTGRTQHLARREDAEEVERRREQRRHLAGADVEEALQNGRHAVPLNRRLRATF